MKRAGLTLIELLVAMMILAIIVLAVAQLFQQSTVAWESGYRRTNTAMIGRAILGYVAHDISSAVWQSGAPPAGMTFESGDGTNLLDVIAYSGRAALARNSILLYESTPGRLEITDFDVGFAPPANPRYADISLKVKTTDKGRDEERRFTTRVYLANWNRYYYD